MSIIGATAAAALKLIGNDVSVEFITFWQFLICLLITVVTLYRHHTPVRELLHVKPADRMIVLVRGVSGFLGFYAFYYAITKIPLIESVMLRHSSPLFVPILTFLWLGNKTQKSIITIIAVGFLGVFITLRPGFETFSSGHLFGLASAAFLAISMVTTNRLKAYKLNNILFYYYLISVLGMIPLGITHWQSVTITQGLLMLYIGVSIHAALWLYSAAFTLSSAALVSPMTYLSVIHAGILGWLLWGHVPALLSIAGMCIVATCGIATSIIGSQQKAT